MWGKKQLKTFLVFPLWTVDHNNRQLSRICHTPRRICNNGVGFIVRIFLSGHISISTVLLIVEVIICKKAFDKYIWSFLTSILSSAGAEMNQILHLVPWILYFYHFKNASCHRDFWRRNLFFWELNDCRWAFNTSKQCRILCLIFTSKGWSHLCIFTSVHAMWPFCAVLMTFKCSHHIRPILGPNRCQWLLSFWKQLINKIFLETVSHEIGYSESHNSNLSKTFFTKYLRNTSSTHCVFSLIVCKYYWGHDFGGKKTFSYNSVESISSFSMVYPSGPIGILPWLIMLGKKVNIHLKVKHTLK